MINEKFFKFILRYIYLCLLNKNFVYKIVTYWERDDFYSILIYSFLTFARDFFGYRSLQVQL